MPWLTASGVAAYLSVSRPTVYALVERGAIPAPTYLTPRCPRWRTEDIDRALTGGAPRESLDDAIERIGRKDRAAGAGGRQRPGIPLRAPRSSAA